MASAVEESIRRKINETLSPDSLRIENESHLHHGHAGSPESGESHFRVEIVSSRFEGLNRIDRQRLVYNALSEELAGPVHALALTTRTPAEDANMVGTE